MLLAGAIGLVVTHIDLFTGASDAVNTLLIVLAPVVFVVGLGLAWWLRLTRPLVYANFAAEPVEPADSVEPAEPVEELTS
ncbi:hypothetical protein ACWCPF_17270 [Streptomyces sp. NPDC001858]